MILCSRVYHLLAVVFTGQGKRNTGEWEDVLVGSGPGCECCLMPSYYPLPDSLGWSVLSYERPGGLNRASFSGLILTYRNEIDAALLCRLSSAVQRPRHRKRPTPRCRATFSVLLAVCCLPLTVDPRRRSQGHHLISQLQHQRVTFIVCLLRGPRCRCSSDRTPSCASRPRQKRSSSNEDGLGPTWRRRRASNCRQSVSC